MKKLKLGLLSLYRKELMGISAIMILICHAPRNGIAMPTIMKYTLVQGQIGVDIFLFLSGMGLWFSLSKMGFETEINNRRRGRVRRWYLNRYTRVLVPYVIIQGLLTAVQCYMDDNLGFWYWLSNVSTIEFWISHRASWFVALLIPLYLTTPVLYEFFKSNSKTKAIGILIVVYFLALFPLNVIGMKADYNNVLYNVQFVMIRIPSFILGMFLAPYIKQDLSVNVMWFIPMFIGAIVMFSLTRTLIDSYMFLVLPVMFLWIAFFSKVGWANKIFRFFGGISLESYLWNGLSIVIVPLMAYFGIPDYNNLLMYSLVLIFGTFLSVLVSKLTKPIISLLTK